MEEGGPRLGPSVCREARTLVHELPCTAPPCPPALGRTRLSFPCAPSWVRES